MTLLLPPGGDSARKVAQAINEALKGKLNSVGTVTLDTGVTSTTVPYPLIGSNSLVFLMPQTAHAAAALGAGTVYVDPANYVSSESFDITHPITVQVDQQFGFVIIG